MRIAGWEIRAFGPLASVVEGLEGHAIVCVLGPNESGKSSLCDFCLSALFGFDEALDPARSRAPWSGAPAEGALDLVIGREPGVLPFGGDGERAHEERVRIWRRRVGAAAPTGVWMTERSELELGPSAIPPLAGRERRLAESLAVLGAETLATPTDAEWERIEERFFVGAHVSLLRSAHTAAARLRRAADRLWRSDRRGKPRHRELEAERDRLRRERRRALQRAHRLRELDVAREALAQALAARRREREAARRVERDQGELAARERELAELGESIERARRRLFGDAPLARVARAVARLDPAPLGELLERCRGAGEVRAERWRELEGSADELALVGAELDELDSAQQVGTPAPDASAALVRRWRGVVALVLGGCAAVGASLELAEPRVLAAGAAILAALGVVEFAGSVARGAELGNEDATRRAELERERTALARREALARRRLAAADEALAALEVERAGWLAQMPLRRELCEHPPVDLSSQLDELAERVARASWLRRQARELRRRIESEAAPAAGVDAVGVAAEVDDALAKLAEERARLDVEVAALEADPQPSAVEGALLALEDELEAVQDERDELALAAAVVGEAATRWRERHTPELFERASRYVSTLTGGRWSGLVVQEAADPDAASGGPALSFGLRAASGGPARAIEAPLSRGLRAQVHFALRLALFEELEAREARETPAAAGFALPLFLDDAFTDWDPDRVTQGLALLTELARGRQVFALTPDPALAERLEREVGAYVVRLSAEQAERDPTASHR